jgi:alkylhydroperoxidase/carboxymuconolactone decarboxylase family protein YurZ
MAVLTMTTQIADALETLGRLAPESVAGYAQLRQVIDTDGALGAGLKALLIGAAAAARGHDALAARELARARELGVTDDELASAAAMLLLSRGEAVVERFGAAAGPIAPAGPPRPPDERDGTTYCHDYTGMDELPSRVTVMADRSPAAFEGYHRMHHAALSVDPAAALLSELVCCTVNAAELRGDFVAVHVAGAVRGGASRAQLIEAILCAIPVAGVAAWGAAVDALPAA